MTALALLANNNIPTHSYVAAIQHITSTSDLAVDEYRSLMVELSGMGLDVEDTHAKFTYLYLVQEIIRDDLDGRTQSGEEVYIVAREKAQSYIRDNRWVLFTLNGEVDQNGSQSVNKPTARKGAKKLKAAALWDELGGSSAMSRKDWIAKLVDVVDLTPAGASTYYSNLKNH